MFDRMKHRRTSILLDGEGAIATASIEGKRTKVLPPIFSATVIGPFFFEFIQRKGDEGSGQGNVRALLLSIEEEGQARGASIRSPLAAGFVPGEDGIALATVVPTRLNVRRSLYPERGSHVPGINAGSVAGGRHGGVAELIRYR
jgi:hypothetical protein